MSKSKTGFVFLILFLLADLTFSFVQYYQTPLFGDMASHIIPDEVIQPVFDDPLGFEAIATGEKHSNPNRYFSHLMLKEYFQNVPFWLQQFTSPVNSVYLASALIKLLVQVIFILLVAMLVTGENKPASPNFLIAAAITAPLFQVYGFWSRMGIVDKSVAYTFFYAVPLVLLMLFLLPVFQNLMHHKKTNVIIYFLLIPLVIALPLSGPLVPAVILIAAFLIFLHFAKRIKTKGFRFVVQSAPLAFYILVLPASLWSLYSLFLGFYNSNYAGEMIPVWERYLRLLDGIQSQLSHSLGYPLMLIVIAVNLYLLKRYNLPQKSNLFNILKWIALFVLIYILLLPFGGYRPYRPRIIRYDTIMPITMALIYYFSATTFYVATGFLGMKKRYYRAGIIIVLLVFVFADLEGTGENKCERWAFREMASTKEDIVALPDGCFVLDWENNPDYRQTHKEAELIHFWNITPEKKLYYNAP